jgi:phage terminase large subunit GpA-like protein
MIPIVKACTEPHYKRVIAVMGSQMGKTAGLLNVIGQRLDDDPAPIIYIAPTKNNIDNVIEPKLTELMKSVPSLWNKLAKGKKVTKTHKRIAGVSLRLAWAGSPTELASDSAVLVLVDEIDRMEDNVKGEGQVFELAEARTSTYADGRVVGTSTPTLGNVDTFIHPATQLEHWAVSDTIASPI